MQVTDDQLEASADGGGAVSVVSTAAFAGATQAVAQVSKRAEQNRITLQMSSATVAVAAGGQKPQPDSSSARVHLPPLVGTVFLGLLWDGPISSSLGCVGTILMFRR